MSVTILEALQNAHYNLCVQKIPGISDKIGEEQLTNAIGLLEKGYDVYDEVEPLLHEYGSIEKVPNKPSPTV